MPRENKRQINSLHFKDYLTIRGFFRSHACKSQLYVVPAYVHVLLETLQLCWFQRGKNAWSTLWFTLGVRIPCELTQDWNLKNNIQVDRCFAKYQVFFERCRMILKQQHKPEKSCQKIYLQSYRSCHFTTRLHIHPCLHILYVRELKNWSGWPTNLARTHHWQLQDNVIKFLLGIELGSKAETRLQILAGQLLILLLFYFTVVCFT